MAKLVQKFGGTSVGSVERIQAVARRLLDTQAKGHQNAAVVSAMAGETNRLISLAMSINPLPYSREYDLMVASGEQVSVGLLSLAINTEARKRGLIGEKEVKACPLLGHQLGIQTDSVYSKARIKAISTDRLNHELERGMIPVIAGFQGVDMDNNITTMGRGGSDTSAVAIAAAMKADECEILTDVDGVYTTDPRVYPGARKIKAMSYEEMMELASVGAKVLQIRSVELAAVYQVPLNVRSSLNWEPGTMVVTPEKLKDLGVNMEQVVVSAVASDMAQVKIALQNIPDQPGVAAKVFSALSEAEVVVDVIVLSVPADNKLTISFTVGEADDLQAQQVLEKLKRDLFKDMRIVTDKNLAKVSIVGVGMQHHPGVASKFFQILADNGMNIHLVSTSEIKVSALIPEDQAKVAVKSVHQGFNLDEVQG